jgi:CRISPR type III-A-associated protein Csm2
MNKIPLEKKLAAEWKLDSAERIHEKIFENSSENMSLKDFLKDEILIVCSYALGNILVNQVRLGSAQLRRFYESFNNIKTYLNIIKNRPDAQVTFEKRIKNEILQLKPQLAYAVKRQEDRSVPFFQVVNPLIDQVHDIADFERLCQFVEATVAYHKYCDNKQ